MSRRFQFSLPKLNQKVAAPSIFIAGLFVGVTAWITVNWGDRDLLSEWWWYMLVPHALLCGILLYLGDKLSQSHERRRL